MKTYLLLFVLFLFLLVFSGCSSKQYNVQFVADDELIEIVSVKEGKSVTKIADPEKEGYDFIGWFDDNDELYDFSKPITDNISLVAAFEKQIYHIAFYDGDELIYEKDYEYGANVRIPTINDKQDDDYNYRFIGWDHEVSSKATSTITYKTTYQVSTRTYLVTYYDENGEVLQSVNVEKGKNATNVNMTKANDERYTYSFKGWYLDGNTKYDFMSLVVSDINLYPVFECIPVYFSTKGAKISILGDSVSTFYSESSTVNSIYHGTNQYYYPLYSSTVKTVDKTWWYMLANNLEASISVNESLSGSSCYGYTDSAAMSEKRIKNLGLNGTPDIIIVFIGTNDNVNGFSEEQFTLAYSTMLSRIKENYPLSYVFCFSLGYSNYHLNQPDNHHNYSEEDRLMYNRIISEQCDRYGVKMIDIASIQTTKTWSQYLGDNLHLNYTGMKAVASYATTVIKEYFDQSRPVYAISYDVDEDVTLSNDDTYIFYKDEVKVLPSATKPGYDFLGWYLNSDFEGDKVVSTKGFNEDIVLYPHFEVTLKDGEYRVYYKLNGGKLGETNKEVILANFLHDYSLFVSNDWGEDITLNELKDLSYDGNENKFSSPYYYATNVPNGTDYALPKFFRENIDSWGWLINLLHENAATDKAYVSDNTVWPEPIVVNLWAFFYDTECEWNGVKSANYGDVDSLNATLEDFALYNKKVYSGEVTLPVPTFEGHTFLGWYTNPNFSGNAVTKVSSGVTVYAKWE